MYCYSGHKPKVHFDKLFHKLQLQCHGPSHDSTSFEENLYILDFTLSCNIVKRFNKYLYIMELYKIEELLMYMNRRKYVLYSTRNVENLFGFV